MRLASGYIPDRVAQRLRVVATYEAASGRDPKILYGGLCNQIYSHVGMLAVLLQLGAEVVRAHDPKARKCAKSACSAVPNLPDVETS